MAGRPLRRLRNKPMPESPKVVAAAEAVFETLPPGKGKVITVPWEHLVFSTREGRPYMPPTLAEGLRRVLRKEKHIGQIATPKGVRLNLRTDPNFSGWFDASPLGGMFYTLNVRKYPGWRDTLRHELLHFTQAVASDLIAASHGVRSFPGHSKTPEEFGLPKKKLRTYDPADLTHGREVDDFLALSMHGRGDMEHFPNALSVSLQAARAFPSLSKKPTPRQLAEVIVEYAGERTALFGRDEVEHYGLSDLLAGSQHPGSAREAAFLKLAWQLATEELGMSGDVTPEVSRVLGIPVQKSRSTVVPRRTVKPSETSRPQQPEQQEILYTKTGQPYMKVGGKVRFLPRTAR